MDICCVFWPANGCFACHLLVEIIFFSVLNIFSVTNSKKRAKNKENLHTKNGVYQCLAATLKQGLTPKHWLTPGENIYSTRQAVPLTGKSSRTQGEENNLFKKIIQYNFLLDSHHFAESLFLGIFIEVYFRNFQETFSMLLNLGN